MTSRARVVCTLLATALAAGTVVVTPAYAAVRPLDQPTLRPAADADVPIVGTSGRGSAIARRSPTKPPVPTGTPMPTPRVALPAALDRLADYSPQISCDPTDKPGSIAYGELLKSIYPQTIYGISRSCTESGTSEHKDGRAVDFMINANDPAQKKIADDIVAWLTANQGAMARRLGVMYLIWNRQIWGTWDIPGGWQPYSGSSPHTDHIHTSLTWDGAMKNTSWWTGVALTTWDEGPCQVYQGEPAAIYTARRIDDCPAAVAPPKTTHPSTVHGSTGTEVTTAQRLLGVATTGKFDWTIWMAVRRYQAAKGIAVTGVLDQKTWSLLDPASLR
ncbi:MAG: peptidoglycan-binding protein [Austwickia sp.]|nr:peptidoglycan-binding protein [Austwickia sp.]